MTFQPFNLSTVLMAVQKQCYKSLKRIHKAAPARETFRVRVIGISHRPAEGRLRRRERPPGQKRDYVAEALRLPGLTDPSFALTLEDWTKNHPHCTTSNFSEDAMVIHVPVRNRPAGTCFGSRRAQLGFAAGNLGTAGGVTILNSNDWTNRGAWSTATS